MRDEGIKPYDGQGNTMDVANLGRIARPANAVYRALRHDQRRCFSAVKSHLYPVNAKRSLTLLTRAALLPRYLNSARLLDGVSLEFDILLEVIPSLILLNKNKVRDLLDAIAHLHDVSSAKARVNQYISNKPRPSLWRHCSSRLCQ